MIVRNNVVHFLESQMDREDKNEVELEWCVSLASYLVIVFRKPFWCCSWQLYVLVATYV